MKVRIEKYEFVRNEDFITISEKKEIARMRVILERTILLILEKQIYKL